MKFNSLNTKISRRDFLKLCGLSIGAGLFTVGSSSVDQVTDRIHGAATWLEKLGADPQVEFNGQLFRGTQAGAIQSSTDGGKSWKTLTVLHDQCPVTGLRVVNGQLAATLEFQGHPFSLLSSNGKTWKNG